jgi:hypothetical protein
VRRRRAGCRMSAIVLLAAVLILGAVIAIAADDRMDGDL